MLTAGALALYAAAETATMAPPPIRPTRPAPKADRRPRILRAFGRMRIGLTGLVDGPPWLPAITRSYPY
jgi:hypothetical protein